MNMPAQPNTSSFVICLKNDGYPASLELRKVYRSLPDEEATELGLVRVIDESGEDYLYPKAFFAPISLRPDVREALESLAAG